MTAVDEELYLDILDAVVVDLKAKMAEGEIADADILKQKLPWNLLDKDKGAFVTPLTESWAIRGSETRQQGYPVQVTLFRRSNQDNTSDFDVMKWRKRISDHFGALVKNDSAGAFFTSVPAVFNIAIEPGPVIDEAAFRGQFDATTLVIRCITRENL